MFKFSLWEKLLEVCRILRFYQKPEVLFSGVLLKRCRHGAFVFAGILKSWSRAAQLSPAINTNKGLYKYEKFAAQSMRSLSQSWVYPTPAPPTLKPFNYRTNWSSLVISQLDWGM